MCCFTSCVHICTSASLLQSHSRSKSKGAFSLSSVIQLLPLQCRTYRLHHNHLLINRIQKGQPIKCSSASLMTIPGLLLGCCCFFTILKYNFTRKLSFWKRQIKTKNRILFCCQHQNFSEWKGAPEKSCTTLPEKIVTLTGVIFPRCRKLQNAFPFYRALSANTELLFTIDPPWHCQNVWKLLCSSLYDSQSRQNGPVVPWKCLLCRIMPNHTATGDVFWWFDPLLVIFTVYLLVHVWKFTPTCVHMWLANLGHMVTWTEVYRYSLPHAI